MLKILKFPSWSLPTRSCQYLVGKLQESLNLFIYYMIPFKFYKVLQDIVKKQDLFKLRKIVGKNLLLGPYHSWISFNLYFLWLYFWYHKKSLSFSMKNSWNKSSIKWIYAIANVKLFYHSFKLNLVILIWK